MDVARAARGAAASSSRGDAFQHLARLDFATRAAGPARDRARLLPPRLGGLHVSELATRAIATSAASGAPRSTSKPKPAASRAPRTSKKDAAALEAFVEKCCEDVGRGGDAQAVRAVVGALRDAGRDTMRRLEDFGESDAMAAGVPLRLAVAMRRRIAGQAVERETSRSVETETAAEPARTTSTASSTEADGSGERTNDAERDDDDDATIDERRFRSKVSNERLRDSDDSDDSDDAFDDAFDVKQRAFGKMPRSTRPDPSRGNVAERASRAGASGRGRAATATTRLGNFPVAPTAFASRSSATSYAPSS
jgi:hypothetical protein